MEEFFAHILTKLYYKSSKKAQFNRNEFILNHKVTSPCKTLHSAVRKIGKYLYCNQVYNLCIEVMDIITDDGCFSKLQSKKEIKRAN